MSSVLYVGVDLHEKESQVAVFEQDGALVEERKRRDSILSLRQSGQSLENTSKAKATQ